MTNLNRRELGLGAAVLTLTTALQAGNALAQTGPVRKSLSRFSADPRLVTALRRGVQVMRSRPPSDPTSWFFQGAIHAYNDGLYGDAILLDPQVGNVDRDRFWNQCPHNLPGHPHVPTADFLLWHRAYLYYFERILREAAQEPDLALPYWDYDYVAADASPTEIQKQHEARSFPSIFARQFLDDDDRVPNSLFHANRELAFVVRRYELAPAVAVAAQTMSAPTFFHQLVPRYSRGLAGSHVADDPDIPNNEIGRIESSPHNDIHLAVGGVIGANNGAMADVPTAAFDPVFWVHHASVDRLWTVWASASGKSWGRMPPGGYLDAKPWFFYDADKSVKNESRRFWFDHRSIGTAYDSDVAGARYLTLPASLMVASTAPEWRRQSVIPLLEGAPIRFTESITNVAPSALSPDLLAQVNRLRRDQHSDRRAVLVLEGIGFQTTPNTGFNVVLTIGGQRYEVGRLALFGSALSIAGDRGQMSTMGDMAHMRHGGAGTTQVFDVTSIVQDRSQANAFALSFEPYDLYASVDASPVERRDPTLTVSRAYIAVLTR